MSASEHGQNDRMTDDDIIALVRQHFGLEVTVESWLPGERDLNVLLQDRDQNRWVAKFAAMESTDALQAEGDAMRWISRVAPDLPVPRVRSTPTGPFIVEHAGSQVRLYSYLEGVTLAQANRHAPSVLYSVGALIGAVDRALDAFERPALSRSFRWNPMHAAAFANAHLNHLSSNDQRARLNQTIADATDALNPLLTGLRTGTIHGDGNDHNILVSSTASDASACGLIDFGDLMHSWTISGPAIACAYAMLDTDAPATAAVALIRGVHSTFAIPAQELAAILPLVMLRLAVTVTNAARARTEEPDNTYLQITENGAWRLLEQLANVSVTEITDRFHAACYPSPIMSAPEIRDTRSTHLGPSLSLSYNAPLMITRGDGVRLFDEHGNAYLDCVNNVNCVGHCHPRVVQAAHEQSMQINTNTRYLHPNIVTYAEQLTATLPDPLNVCYIVNSGTEANELALRLARTYTRRAGIVALTAGYHGNTQGLIDVSSYKCERAGGSGPPPHVRFAPCPDPYRGPHRGADTGPAYAKDVERAIRSLFDAGHPVAAFLAESMSGCGGQIIPPTGYLKNAYQFTRDSGGVCIADEVQTGLGRVGSHFWAFETQDVVPDIVTMGKPLGNGHPLAAVVTTREIADAFHNGMEFFNTFGGNPVSCAVGLAVLDVIEAEGLRQHAATVGDYWQDRLRELQSRHQLIGDVRGAGLFIGVELVTDRETRQPATSQASDIANRMRDKRILISIDGPQENVIKIKPPLVIRRRDIDVMCDTLDDVLGQIAAS